jgi:hypothetical protein
MNRTTSNFLKGTTRRSILKMPLLCWFTSLFNGSDIAKALGPDTIGKGSTIARRAISLNGAWSLTYGPLSEYPQKSPGHGTPARLAHDSRHGAGQC